MPISRRVFLNIYLTLKYFFSSLLSHTLPAAIAGGMLLGQIDANIII
jgi:hypothetical protein